MVMDGKIMASHIAEVMCQRILKLYIYIYIHTIKKIIREGEPR